MARIDGLILLDPQLSLNRCPHCGVDRPSLTGVWATETTAHNGTNAAAAGTNRPSKMVREILRGAIARGLGLK
jgi:hypothetical protein